MSELKQMPVVTVEQVVRFRSAAIDRIASLEAQLKSEREERRDDLITAKSSADDYWDALQDIEILVRDIYADNGEDKEISKTCNLIFKRMP